MKLKIVSRLALVGFAFTVTPVSAQVAVPLNKVEVMSHQVYGAAQTHQLVNDATVPGGKAMRMIMADPTAQPWNAGLNSIIQTALVKGDRIEAVIMLRLAPDAGQQRGTVKVLFQLKDSPYTEFAASQAQVKPEWTPFRLKAKVTQLLDAGKARIALQLAYGKQTIDVGPILVTKTVSIQ
jgi:hypothetical protein